MARVFISHSSRDERPAAEMKSWLETVGFEQIFLDFDHHSGIGLGADWERTLYREIERCQALVIILTPNWLESKWCFAEFTQARALGKPIFPVIETPSGETMIASDIQHLDLTKDREGGLERLAASLTEIALNTQGRFDWDTTRSPFPGLLAFEAEDAAIYFGRDDDIRALTERLNARRVQGGRRLIALLGASGSGKSSVLRAGVLPRLRRDGANWIVVPPFRPQSAPVDELARALSLALGRGNEWREIRSQLQDGDFRSIAADFVHDLRVTHNALNAQILITIDQAEELFSTVPDADRQAFFTGLNTILEGDLPLIVVAGLRSDYLGSLQTEERLTAPFEEFSLKPMPLERIDQVIRGPAKVAGLRVEDSLVARLTKDAETEDALPLLAFALRELYDRFGKDGDLTLAEYEALGDRANDLTPLENAVKRKADDVLETARPNEIELQALKDAFVPAMVRVNDEGEFVRRPAQWDLLPAASRDLLEHLVKARLLVLRQDNDVRVVEVAHEALLRKWPKLAGWLTDEREFLIGKSQLERDVADWDRASETQKPLALLSGLKLSRAEVWLKERPQQLDDRERAFIAKSVDAANTSRRRALRNRRFVTWGAAAAAAIIGIFGWWAYGVYQERNIVRHEAARTDIRGELIAYATAKGQYALDTMEGSNTSPYTSALVKALRSRSRGVHGALTALNQRVVENSKGRQRPFISTSMNGEIYLWDQPDTRKRLALVISADHVGRDASPLQAPRHDADAFAQVLRDAGFKAGEVIRLHNPDKEKLLSTLSQQLQALEVADLQRKDAGSITVLQGIEGLRVEPAGITVKAADPQQQRRRRTDQIPERVPYNRGLETEQREASDNTLYVFYYAGHGAAIDDGEYIVLPSDQDVQSQDDISKTGVNLTRISNAITERAAAAIMILDANFTFAFSRDR